MAWINAEDSTTLQAGLAQVKDRLPKLDSEFHLDTDGSDPLAVRHWLETDGYRCLLVFDNAEDLDVLRRFIPTAGHARVVITSTRRSVANLGASVPVDVFTRNEATSVLAVRTGHEDRRKARVLAEELGWLPLALAQAAAVIAGKA